MYVYDKEQLFAELKKIEEAQPEDDIAEVRELFLLLSGNKRVVEQITMEKIAELFNDCNSLLSLYFGDLTDIFHLGKLKDFQCVNRRAV